MMNLLEHAFMFALRAHEGQYRKYDGDPYIVHPCRVASTVKRVCGDPEVIAAAFLHDVVEDCGITESMLGLSFGNRVARLVMEVSDVSKLTDGNRERRKQIDREHYGRASPDGMTIKLAELIDNTISIVADDPDFAVVYLREKKLLLPLLTKGNALLWGEAYDLAYRVAAPTPMPDIGFCTNVSDAELLAAHLRYINESAYRSRWPKQEQNAYEQAVSLS